MIQAGGFLADEKQQLHIQRIRLGYQQSSLAEV